MQNLKWKIIQTNLDEYILLSDSNTIKKIKGKNATDIITVLDALQNNKSVKEIENILQLPSFHAGMVEDILDWLAFNKFIYLKSKSNMNINIIGEFGEENLKLTHFIESLPNDISIDTIYNLSKKDIELIPEKQVNIPLTLLIAPFFYNSINIQKICRLQQQSNSDFLFIELFNNGILLGPLMNSSKDTVCLNCIETRRLFNVSNPDLVIENIIDRKTSTDNSISVFDIGNFELNKVFIYNELSRAVERYGSNLYNKSIFIDFNNFENQHFNVYRTPNCDVCNPIIIYNPL